MSVKLSEDEVNRFLNESLVVTIITINPDGMPLPAPMWYVNKGTDIYFRTMRKYQKAKNIARDPRAVAQIESGQKYLELKAVILRGRIEEVTDPAVIEWWNEAREKKYAAHSVNRKTMPAATQKHYGSEWAFYRLIPDKVKTWDNSKIRMGAAA